MSRLFVVVLFTAGAAMVAPAEAADGCGPGCHSALQGECVVDGWTSGARVVNECPAGSRPRRPCPAHSAWKFGTCFPD